MNRLRCALLTWYAAHGRADLPWRHTSDPYAVWVSEVVLQQTRVEQGRGYYERFLRRFPTVERLASATQTEVLTVWEGLGYYSRARHLHQAAQAVARSGRMPQTLSEWRALPGVGPYTAAAVCAFSRGEAVAAVDGNYQRVLCRYFGLAEPPTSPQGRKAVEQLASQYVEGQDGRAANGAMMDFGATLCRPQRPRCPDCPLADGCYAGTHGEQAALPARSRRTAVRPRYLLYCLVSDGQRVLTRRRPAGDIWQGLYEPLLLETESPLTAEQAIEAFRRAWPALAEEATFAPGKWNVVHQLSHQRLTASLLRVRPAQLSSVDGWRAESFETFARLPKPRLMARLLQDDGA